MVSFKKSENINGKFKGIKIVNGEFIDDETGEVVDVASILGKVYGNYPFDMATTQKSDNDVDVDE